MYFLDQVMNKLSINRKAGKESLLVSKIREQSLCDVHGRNEQRNK